MIEPITETITKEALMSSKPVRVAAVATVLAAVPFALASPASAAVVQHGPPPAKGLVGAKRGADAALTQYARRLGTIEAREAASKTIDATDLGLLQTATGAEATAIVTDRAAVAAATTIAAVRSAVESGRTSLSAAVLDWQVVVAADRVEARDASLVTEETALAAEASADSSAGKTVPPTVSVALSGIDTETTSSESSASAAVTAVTSLAAAPAPSSVRAARLSAVGDLGASRQDLAAALHDASVAIQLLATL